MGKTERKALLVQLALLVSQEREESMAHRDCTVSRVCLEGQDHLESLGSQALRVWLERLVLVDLQVPGEKEALQEREVKSGPTG